jgi:hypothetical protein
VKWWWLGLLSEIFRGKNRLCLRAFFWLWWSAGFAGVFANIGVQNVVLLWLKRGGLRGKRGQKTACFVVLKNRTPCADLFFSGFDAGRRCATARTTATAGPFDCVAHKVREQLRSG